MPGSNTTWRSPKRCFYCGLVGHLIRYCKRRPRLWAHLPKGPSAAQNIATPLSGNSLHLEIQLPAGLVDAVIDTGSSCSVIPSAWVKEEEMMRCDALLMAANQAKIRAIGRTVLTCQIEQYSYDLPCLVVDDIHELILGTNWLEQVGATIDFRRRSIQV